jgi:hypothetical protein
VLVLALAAALLLLFASPAAATHDTGAKLAASLEDNPVYADPAARPTLTPAQAERVRLRIAEKAPGRLRIAVVPSRLARELGGVKGLAASIDRSLDVNGTLLVLAGNNAWVTVSYPAPERAVSAVRRAFAGRGAFADQLLAAVDNLGRADPGPGGDGAGTPANEPGFTADDVDDAVRLIFWIVGALIALPFLIVGFLVLRAVRRRTHGSTGLEQPRLSTPPTAPVSTDRDAQRKAAERAFGGD